MDHLKIKGIFLLTIYLFVFLQQIVVNEISHLSETQNSHQHSDYTDIHHEHHFHVGIFHFLGHLIENISKAGDQPDDHIAIFQGTLTKKTNNQKTLINKFFHVCNPIAIEVDGNSLQDPPPQSILYLSTLSPNPSSLRGPPYLV